jgi:hypothetical protein
MTSDQHDKITAKLIKASTLSIWKGDLNPSKSPNQGERGTCHGAENLLEFRNKFHNFRISIKIPLDFYRFNLVLVRLKLTGKSSAR